MGTEYVEGRVSYSEERAINVGDFEKIANSLRITLTVKPINNVDDKVEVSESDTQTFTKDGMQEAIEAAMLNVISKLDDRDRLIRKRSRRYAEFDTVEKGKVLRGEKKAKEKKTKKKTKKKSSALARFKL